MHVQATSLAQRLRTPAWHWWAPAGASSGWWASSSPTWLSTLPASAGRPRCCLILISMREPGMLRTYELFQCPSVLKLYEGLAHASMCAWLPYLTAHSKHTKQKAW